ncbi:flagellar basal body P-ring protein FlgI [Zavarzinia compransoris]|uniref:flagellar basal body P-ring protein FlgI n=1 Tax=Zavarzinia marina TaxID=2911065 RepID=UPI001F15FE1F|nr:flagellar basal body P-ring protein FlgI [Zavarzinia marina]MCF4166589.1 flagellar basal body P-ring protein FlgI [Zavarzinia marina]
MTEVEIMLKPLCAALALCAVLVTPFSGVMAAQSRIKDIAAVQGVRDNMLVGYGLVVGLDGSGDSLRNAPFTKQSLEAMLERLGVNTRDSDMKTKNVAAVMVTAELPPFGRAGSRLDVTISTLGDAKSLAGGTLLVTPLLGADGEVYAVAQGQVSISGFKAQGAGTTVTKGVPTSGRIANGAVVEKEVAYAFGSEPTLRLALRNPDFTTARRVAQAVNGQFKGAARALDPSTVEILIPAQYRGDIVAYITRIEQLMVTPDQRARIVIDEASGTIVIGADVRVSTVAIAQGNLTVRITETPQVSQPAPFSGGQTTVVPRSDVQVDEGGEKRVVVMEAGVSLQDLVNGLNGLGLGPRDMIPILEAIKAAGALQADIEVM